VVSRIEENLKEPAAVKSVLEEEPAIVEAAQVECGSELQCLDEEIAVRSELAFETAEAPSRVEDS